MSISHSAFLDPPPGMVYCAKCNKYVGESKAHTCHDPHPTYTTFGGVLTQEDIEKLREIHGWLAELMPAARAAVKMMDARTSLMRRWRGVPKEE